MNDDRRHDTTSPRTRTRPWPWRPWPACRVPRLRKRLERRPVRSSCRAGAAAAEVRSIEPRRRVASPGASLMMAAALGVLAVVWFGSTPTEQWVVLDVVNPGGVTVTEGASAVGDRLAGGRWPPDPRANWKSSSATSCASG